MPVSYDEATQTFRVVGTFCSWACIKAHNRDNPRTYCSRGTDANIITLMHKRVTGTLTGITSAPPRYLLEAFGGPLTLLEFRGASGHGTHYNPMLINMVLADQVVEERKANDMVRKLKEQTMVLGLDSCVDLSRGATMQAQTVEPLKLKRPEKKKPQANIQSMLEKSLGLTVK